VRAVSLKLALANSSHEIHREVGDRCAIFVKRGHTNTLWARSRFLSQFLLGLAHFAALTSPQMGPICKCLVYIFLEMYELVTKPLYPSYASAKTSLTSRL
jgi:hypothetical protein